MIKKLGISEDGQHECYKIDGRLTKVGIYSMLGKSVAVGYLGYTGHWYAYDETTGKEIATFTRQFYENFIQPLKVCDLNIDSECVCKHLKQVA